MSTPLVIHSVTFKNNPAKWADPFNIEIIFEARENLDKPMEFQFIYVGSGTDETLDQELERVECETVVKGRHKLSLEVDAPDPAKIPSENVHDVTLFMFKGFYNSKMFTKICWFVSNTYADDEMQQNKPAVPIIEKLTRELGIDDVRVIQYPTCWVEEKQPVVADDVDTNDQGIAFSTTDKIEEEEVTDDDEDDDEEEIIENMAEIDIANESAVNLSGHSDKSEIENVNHSAAATNESGKGDQSQASGDVLMET